MVRAQGLTLRVVHTSPYLQRAYTRAPPGEGVTDRWAEYDALRLLSLAAGARRSLLGPDGIVRGT